MLGDMRSGRGWRYRVKVGLAVPNRPRGDRREAFQRGVSLHLPPFSPPSVLPSGPPPARPRTGEPAKASAESHCPGGGGAPRPCIMEGRSPPGSSKPDGTITATVDPSCEEPGRFPGAAENSSKEGSGRTSRRSELLLEIFHKKYFLLTQSHIMGRVIFLPNAHPPSLLESLRVVDLLP